MHLRFQKLLAHVRKLFVSNLSICDLYVPHRPAIELVQQQAVPVVNVQQSKNVHKLVSHILVWRLEYMGRSWHILHIYNKILTR